MAASAAPANRRSAPAQITRVLRTAGHGTLGSAGAVRAARERETARRRDPSTLDQLTPQELQIARLVAGVKTNPEVAPQLFLSPARSTTTSARFTRSSTSHLARDSGGSISASWSTRKRRGHQDRADVITPTWQGFRRVGALASSCRLSYAGELRAGQSPSRCAIIGRDGKPGAGCRCGGACWS